jgi:hypothetical protein
MDLEILLDLPYRTLSDIEILQDHLASALPLPFVSWFLSYDWIYPGVSYLHAWFLSLASVANALDRRKF